MSKPVIKQVKCAEAYLECGHTIMILRGAVVPREIRCAICDPVIYAQIVAHAKKIERRINTKERRERLERKGKG